MIMNVYEILVIIAVTILWEALLATALKDTYWKTMEYLVEVSAI